MLNITIITSTEDLASSTIKSQLLSKYPFQKQPDVKGWNPNYVFDLHEFEFELNDPLSSGEGAVKFSLIGLNHRMTQLDEIFGESTSNPLFGDLIIFASRHRAASGKPGLLVHTPGNWSDDTSAGGFPKRIAKGSGLLLYYLYTHLTRFVAERAFPVKVDQEATHHGPSSLDLPIAFIELGSKPEDWDNVEGAAIIADTIILAGKSLVPHFQKDADDQLIVDKLGIHVCVGFGGTHYMPNFSKHISEGFTFVHCVPKYHIAQIDAEMIDQIRQNSLESIDHWVIDWKGTNSEHKAHIRGVLDSLGIPYLKTKDLKKDSEVNEG